MNATAAADGLVRAQPMRKVLFHSYHFPPIGGSGAQRPLKLARYLLASGYLPVVVTGGGATDDRWAPEDSTLISEIPRQIEVWRVPATTEPGGASRWRGRAERWLWLRPEWSRWWIDGSVRLGLEAGRDVDLIYVWMQPYDSAEAGAELSRRLGLPWVADLGDPWALDEMMVYPSALHRRRELRRMGKLLSSAAAIVMSTQEAVRRVRAEFPELAHKPVTAIPNGFDASDFEAAPPQRGDNTFRIVHTGYFHTDLGRAHRRKIALRRILGGSVDGLDILTRSHVYLIEAINRLLAAEPTLKSTLELHLAGVLTNADHDVARRCAVVQLHGYVTHAESVALLRSADLLFLPMQNLPAGVRATIVPGKTYEYVASGIPVLGAVPEGDARDLLTEAGNAILCLPNDIDGMVAAIHGRIEAARNGRRPQAPREDVVAQFEYRHLAGRLASLFDTVLETQ